jgi:hypothetical protein
MNDAAEIVGDLPGRDLVRCASHVSVGECADTILEQNETAPRHNRHLGRIVFANPHGKEQGARLLYLLCGARNRILRALRVCAGRAGNGQEKQENRARQQPPADTNVAQDLPLPALVSDRGPVASRIGAADVSALHALDDMQPAFERHDAQRVAHRRCLVLARQ